MKRFLLMTCASLIAAAPASANLSRATAMGAALFFGDDSNVHIFPQRLADYTNRGIGELEGRGASSGSRSAGIHVHLKKMGMHMGMYANAPGIPLAFDGLGRGTGGPFSAGYTSVADHGRQNILAIGSEDGTWGAMLGIGGDKFDSKTNLEDATGTSVRTDESTRSITAGIGIDIDLSDKASSELGLRVGIGSGSIKEQHREDPGDDFTEFEMTESALEFGVVARNTYDRGTDGGKLVAVGSVGIASAKAEVPDVFDIVTAGEAKRSGFSAALGAGWHYPVAANVIVVPGIELFGIVSESGTFTDEDGEFKSSKSTITYLSPFFAMEAWLNSWFAGRVGVKQANSLRSGKDESNPTDGDSSEMDDPSTASSLFDITFGLGIKLGDNFMVDGVFNEDFLFAGPNFLTGGTTVGREAQGSSGSWMSRVSVWGRW